MPSGVNAAPEEFECKPHEHLSDLPGVEVLRDDILVIGSGGTLEQATLDHDENLLKLLKRALAVNLKFNSKKLNLRKPEVKYMGHVLSSEGLKPDPNKVAAHDDSFEEIKKLVTRHPVLKFYDMNSEVTIQCDASVKGLGATLLQNGQPVAFASRTLSQVEQRYAQIKKERLAIVFACTKFSQYITRREKIIVESDHKLLQSIFKKSLLAAPSRLQRMLLRLQRYNLDVQYKPGSQMYVADHLSRANLKHQVRPEVIWRLHSSHLGIEACLKKARDRVYWPAVNSDIKEVVTKCQVCAEYQASNPQQPLQTQRIPERPWSQLAADLFTLQSKDYIVQVDYYSDFVEVSPLRETTSAAIIKSMRVQFSRHGTPDILVTDNGPQFASREFAEFAKQWEFLHVTSSSYYPRPKGKAESAVKVVKILFKKALKDQKDPWLSLLDYRNTPTAGIH
ncbi:Retrovirus-related Pol polyprotein from transposon 17.6 [Stylophora pistillata]|uniref:Retrovirus-related Pol polyprotein from transposon 17.6 n=1 Tax=Stylophora pistillata TaxID=50429 RepID=A0A2B4SAT4_STYPI|nr:Retrovirus-related Pol polyprotein from transposon 17.6 [Stylophora pistillata]